MRKIQITLSDESAAFVERAIERGRFGSVDELFEEALDALENDEGCEPWKLESLRLLVAVGDAQAARGEFSDRTVEEIFEEVLAERGRDAA
jgi:putative addiction module CopG family antidote